MRQLRRVILPMTLVVVSGLTACGNIGTLAFSIALWVGEVAVKSVIAHGLETVIDSFFSPGDESVQASGNNPLVGVATRDWMVAIGADPGDNSVALQIRIPAAYLTFYRASRYDEWKLSRPAEDLVHRRVHDGRVQLALQIAGYTPGDVDGIWGDESRRAMREFQEKNGLTPTGELDASSQQALHL